MGYAVGPAACRRGTIPVMALRVPRLQDEMEKLSRNKKQPRGELLKSGSLSDKDGAETMDTAVWAN